MMATSETARQFIVLFGTLTPDIARKLSAHLKSTRDVGAASPTIDDLCVQRRALALIARALEDVDMKGPFTDTAMDYREG